MNKNHTPAANELDCIRRTRGIRVCRNSFRSLALSRRETAVRLVNGDSLLFATLYVLQPVLSELNLDGLLSERDRTALKICDRITQEKKAGDSVEEAFSLNSEAVHSVLLWMFQTGMADDGLNEEFDQILDITASILIKTHHEKTVQPDVAELIFRRNRKGAYLHDLTWAYFQTRDTDALRIVAKHLLSSDRKDAEFAGMLLHMEPDELKTARDRRKKYTEFNGWLDENSPYLYFTNESFQLTNNPVVCDVDLDAEYLGKGISPRSRRPLSPLTNEENGCLRHFKETPDDDRTVLAKYSHRLHKENPAYWAQWLQFPVEEQLQIARDGRREQP